MTSSSIMQKPCEAQVPLQISYVMKNDFHLLLPQPTCNCFSVADPGGFCCPPTHTLNNCLMMRKVRQTTLRQVGGASTSPAQTLGIVMKVSGSQEDSCLHNPLFSIPRAVFRMIIFHDILETSLIPILHLTTIHSCS